MAKFTKKIEFTAYQFNPDELKGLDNYAIEDVVAAALGGEVEIKSAFVNIHGNLDVVFYTYGCENPKEWFVLTPGDWVTYDGGVGFAVVGDDDFKKFASPAE